MNLIDYGRILVRRGWIMLLLAALAAGTAYFISRQQTPIYRATQLILIQPSRNDLGLTEATTRLMNSYQVYLNSTLIAQRVIDNLSLDMLSGDLMGDVIIEADRDRLTVQIDVDMADCAVASRVAQEWGNMLVSYRNAENQRVRAEDRIAALPVDVPLCGLRGPSPFLNAAAGGLLGLLLGGVIVFVLEYLESSIIHRREDLERALEMPVLATIPDSDR